MEKAHALVNELKRKTNRTQDDVNKVHKNLEKMRIHFLDKAIGSSDQEYKDAQRAKKKQIVVLQEKILKLQSGGKHKQSKRSRKQSKRSRKH